MTKQLTIGLETSNQVNQWKTDYSIDFLLDTYIKLTKPVTVYYSDGSIGWKYVLGTNPNDVIGKLYSWIDNSNDDYEALATGVFMQFKINDDYANGKSYFVFLEPDLIDIEFSTPQVTAKYQITDISWSDKMNNFKKVYGIYLDTIKNTAGQIVDKAGHVITDVQNSVTHALNVVALTGVALLGGFVYYNLVLKPKAYGYAFGQAARAFKKTK